MKTHADKALVDTCFFPSSSLYYSFVFLFVLALIFLVRLAKNFKEI